MEATFRRVLVCGKTGVGKSKFINWTLRTSENTPNWCVESDGADSQTNTTRFVRGSFDGGIDLDMGDCPGFEDSLGNDAQNITKMVAKLNNVESIDGVMLIINYTAPRLDSTIKNHLRLLWKLFRHSNMWDNLIVVFTHTPDAASDQSKDEKQSKYLTELRDFIQISGGKMSMNPPCIFVNCHTGSDGTDHPNTKKQRSILAGLLIVLSPMSTKQLEDPGEYLQQEQETMMVVTERESKPVFEKNPIIVQEAILGKDKVFSVGIGDFSLKFGGGSKVIGHKSVEVGTTQKLAGTETSEKGVIMMRSKCTWYDGKTVTYTPWEVKDHFENKDKIKTK